MPALPGRAVDADLRGGTNTIQAPQVDYTVRVFLPFFRRHLVIDVWMHVVRCGYFPKGRGELRIAMSPFAGPLPAMTILARGTPVAVKGYAFVAGLPAHLVRRMQAVAVAKLVEFGVDAAIIGIVVVREDFEDSSARDFKERGILFMTTRHFCNLLACNAALRMLALLV